jgi:hypothetical protein
VDGPPLPANTFAGTSCSSESNPPADSFNRLFPKNLGWSDAHSEGPKYSVAVCSNSFPLRGNEHILEALRNQVKGGPPRLVGTVLKSTGAYSHDGGLDGVSVNVEANGVRRQTIADGLGHYVIPALEPGRYEIGVSKAGYVPDSEYNQRLSGRMVLNPETNRFEPDKSDPGAVIISGNSCSIWNLSMWPQVV